MTPNRPQLSLSAQLKPFQAAVVRRTITDKQMQAESRYATVSATSSTHAMFGEVGVEEKQDPKGADMTSGLKHDVVRTF
jgi:hypothetical protein